MKGKYELIDTQWDVNMQDIRDFLEDNDELIDTQWDVNSNTLIAFPPYAVN